MIACSIICKEHRSEISAQGYGRRHRVGVHRCRSIFFRNQLSRGVISEEIASTRIGDTSQSAELENLERQRWLDDVQSFARICMFVVSHFESM
jgi:hypothetical protein